MPGLHEIELKLRIAQTSDALEQLKQHLRIYSSFVKYKIRQVSGPGQKANTRARNLVTRLRQKAMRSAERYKMCRAALEVLDPTGDWKERLRPLLAGDIQAPNGSSPDDVITPMSRRSKGNGEGFRNISWIWRVRREAREDQVDAEGNIVISEEDLNSCKPFNFRDVLRSTEHYIQI